MDEPQIEVTEKEDGELDVGHATPVADDIDLLPVQGYFNITGRLTGRAKDQLRIVLENAREETQSEDHAKVLMYLRHIENRLGAPKADESRLTQVYNYMKAIQEVKLAEQMRDSFLR